MTSEVATWQPAPQELGPTHVQVLDRAAETQDDALDVTEEDTTLLRELMAANLDQWQALVDAAESATLDPLCQRQPLPALRQPAGPVVNLQ